MTPAGAGLSFGVLSAPRGRASHGHPLGGSPFPFGLELVSVWFLAFATQNKVLYFSVGAVKSYIF